MNEAEKSIEALYKDKYGQLISLILQRFRSLSIESAEDVVQETFTEAAVSWARQGVPLNPSGWLYQTCRNKSINLLKKTLKEVNLSLASATSIGVDEISEHSFKDAQLQMLLTCCHPHLAPKTQVVLALKYVANLKVESIALQLGEGFDAIEKILYRARQKIKGDVLILSGGNGVYSKKRLSIVHKVIYLIFSEGYKQSRKKINQGKMLCEEALLLNKSLLNTSLCNSETKALYALMLFSAARFDTRFDVHGSSIELEYQNRSLWDSSLIKLANTALIESEDSTFSPYHLEASIACVHCAAQVFEDTNWDAICKYYEVLLKIYPSPFAEINYAVALQYNKQDEKAFRILMDLKQNPYYTDLPILDISLKKYFERTVVNERTPDQESANG